MEALDAYVNLCQGKKLLARKKFRDGHTITRAVEQECMYYTIILFLYWAIVQNIFTGVEVLLDL